MSQDLVSQELTAGGNGGGSTSTGFATGSTCTSSGTYRAENKYMATVQLYAAGEVFRPFLDGKKTTWYPLSTTSTSTFSSDGSFTSVKVDAGAA
jgi:hypothetical protein